MVLFGIAMYITGTCIEWFAGGQSKKPASRFNREAGFVVMDWDYRRILKTALVKGLGSSTAMQVL